MAPREDEPSHGTDLARQPDGAVLPPDAAPARPERGKPAGEARIGSPRLKRRGRTYSA